MRCKLCGSDHVKSIYDGFIRDGGLGNYTKETVTMLQCEDCDVIWHEAVIGDSKNIMRRKNIEILWKGVLMRKLFIGSMIEKF